jgi:hypothetical protein
LHRIEPLGTQRRTAKILWTVLAASGIIASLFDRNSRSELRSPLSELEEFLSVLAT